MPIEATERTGNEKINEVVIGFNYEPSLNKTVEAKIKKINRLVKIKALRSIFGRHILLFYFVLVAFSIAGIRACFWRWPS